MKQVSEGATYMPYVIERLQENVEFDRRFYIQVAEHGLSEFVFYLPVELVNNQFCI